MIKVQQFIERIVVKHSYFNTLNGIYKRKRAK